MSNQQRLFYGVVQSVVRPLLFVNFLLQRKKASDSTPTGDNGGIVPGPDLQRVIFIGEATAVGYRTHSQDLGIAAQFARQWNSRNQVGVEWSIRLFPDLTIRTAMKTPLDHEALREVSIVVLMAGIGDVMRFTRPREWRREMTDFLARITSLLSEGAQVFVAAIPPLGLSGDTPGLVRRMAGAHAMELNAITRHIAAGYPNVSLFPFPMEHLKDLEYPDSAHVGRTYSGWARQLVDAVTGTSAE
jgi:hypothetical protein